MKGDRNINNLKNLRRNRHLKTSQITDFLGISEQFYYLIESGKRKLTEEYITKLSDFYNVTSDYIIGRTKHEQGYILEGDNIPKELRDIDVDAIEMLRDANNNGITTEDIKEIIEFRKFMKRLKS